MDSVTFYRDRSKTFKCVVEVSGSPINKTSARLLLDFGKMAYLFPGNLSVQEDGKTSCLITIPPLTDAPDTGEAILEVVAGGHLLTPLRLTLKVTESIKAEAKIVEEIVEKIPTAKVVFEDYDKTRSSSSEISVKPPVQNSRTKVTDSLVEQVLKGQKVESVVAHYLRGS